jgi:hypothetical protein
MPRRRTNRILLALTVLLLVFSTGASFAATPIQIAITLPRDHAKVPWRPCFEGRVSDPQSRVFLVIHDKTGDYYVQPGPISAKEDGTWSTRPYIAEDKPGVFEGVPFEAKAFANPKIALSEGQTLPGWPEAEAASPLIDITRFDDAPSGCAASDPEPAVGPPWVTPTLTGPVVRPEPPAQYVSREVWLTIRVWVLLVAIFLFCAMAALQEQADAAIQWFERWCLNIARSMWMFIPRLWGWVGQHAHHIWSWRREQSARNLAARGFTGNYKQQVVQLALCPMLWCLLLPGVYTEAKSTKVGLSLTLPGTADPNGSGHLHGLLRSRQNPAPRPEPQVPAGSAAVVVMDWIREIRRGDEFLFMALGLAALETALGAILLSGLEGADALRISLPALFRARPIVTFFFLAMDAALTLLAAIRGFEMSPDTVNWVLPTLAAALLAALMPWLLGYTLHFAVESFANCCGPLLAALVWLALLVGAVLAQVGSIVALIVLLALRAIAVAAFGILSFIALAFLLFAKVVGAFLRWLFHHVSGWFPPQTPGDASPRAELS